MIKNCVVSLCTVSAGWFGLMLASSQPASAQVSGLDSPQAVGAYFNAAFPSAPAGQPTSWTTTNAFPNLTFIDPLKLLEIPGTNQFLVVGKNGQLWRFVNNPAVTQAQVVKVLDVSAQTQTSGDQGFYSLVFHPEFGQAGSPNANYAYVCYSHRPNLSGAGPDDNYWRVSRFTWQPATGTFDPASEFVMIHQFDTQSWHNGGAMFFGNEGFLHITCGDGGNSNDTLGNAQRIDRGFFSGMFRIDVNNDPAKSHPIRRQPLENTGKPTGWPASYTQGYGIPNDNPWLDPNGTILEEFFAVGLRSPHAAHYDSLTGEIWVGDVGEGTREEITRVVKGANCQWSYREGTTVGPRTKPTVIIGNEEVPLYDYGRTTGTCIIGGMRYRGAKWASSLGGKVLFGDHVKGQIWSATIVPGGTPTIDTLVTGFHTGAKAGLANFCTDSMGEIYLMDVNGTNTAGGTIRKLVPQAAAAEPPQWLSQTGVFTNLATLQPAQGVVPYDVANPLWSDAAEKQRWIILPNNGTHDTAAEKITFSEKGNWVFPAGTVFVKHFEVPIDERSPAITRRLETRFLICLANGGKYGITYRWNEAGTDAQLLTTGDGLDFDVTLQDGSTSQRHWDFPSRSDCLLCHNTAAGQALGMRTHQLNKLFTYPSTGRTANQLATFNALGMFDRTLTVAELENFLESRSLTDETAPLEHRVRSYLDSNCSHCHQPGATVTYFDARLGTAYDMQGLVNGLLQGHFTMDPSARYIKPGDATLSAVHHRMSHVGDAAAMPPLAKNLIDQQALARVNQYIGSLTPAEFQTTMAPQARYVRLTATSEAAGNAWASVAEFRVLDGIGVTIPLAEMTVSAFDSQETVDETAPASYAIDGNPATFWHTGYGTGGVAPMPHYLTVDLGSIRSVGGFIYTPRQSSASGRIKDYQVHYSQDGVNWTLMNSGTWANNANDFRYDALAEGRPARCEIGGPAGTVGGPFDVTIAFDMNVTDFTAADLQVAGGTITHLRGSGYYYVAKIAPSSSDVTVSIAPNAVNPKGYGSRASNQLQLGFIDTLPPVPRFTGVPSSVNSSFQIGLTFDEAAEGLQLSDFIVTNGSLGSITPAGNSYVLTVIPATAGAVGVEIKGASVVDLAGNVMGEGASISTLYTSYIMAREAESGVLSGAFVAVNNPSASGGAWIWVPEGALPGTALNLANKASYDFVVPRAGQYYVRGLVRSDLGSSDSFYVGFDGTSTPSDWHTNQLAGQVGTGQFFWDVANSSRMPDTSPSVFTLTAGAHSLQIYGRDDGTRIDRIELTPLRPFPTWAGPAVAVNGAFSVTLTFTESVTGLEPNDISITGGTIQSLTGSGASYTAMIQPTASAVVINLPQNVVVDGGGAGNHESDPLIVVYRTAFEQWALSYALEGGDANRMSDEDGDGIARIFEFAFNLDPTKFDNSSPTSGLPALALHPEGEGTRLSLQYVRRKNVAGMNYAPQFGGTLQDFTDAIGTPVIESINSSWERVTIFDEAAPSGAPKRFGRVQVTLPAP